MLLVHRRRGWRGAFGVGAVFGFAHFCVGLYWVGNAFLVAGVLPWAAPFAVAGLAAACALFVASACALYRWLAPRGLWKPVVFASLWTLAEWLRGTLILGGFPWSLAAYVWTPWPAMLQFAALAGAYGLGWLTAFAASAPAAFTARVGGPRTWWIPAAAVALLAVNAAAGKVVLWQNPVTAREDVRLRLVQPNIAQERKWRADLIAERFRRHADLSATPADAPPNVIVWPETASPWDLSRPFAERARVVAAAPRGGALIAGAMRSETGPDGARRLWNSLQALDDSGRVVGQYDKFHLVPFGEYAPLHGFFLTAGLLRDVTGFSAGPGPRTLTAPGAPPFGPLICYEAIFPGAVVDPAARPEWLLNVTNDAWYGDSPGPYQHFEQARLRAVEEGLPLARAANSGISGVIDAWGRVTAKSALGEAVVVDAWLPPPRPPTVFARVGNLPAIAFAAALPPLFVLWRRRRPNRAGTA